MVTFTRSPFGSCTFSTSIVKSTALMIPSPNSLDQPMRSRLPDMEDECDQREMVKLNLRDSEQRAVSGSETIYFV